MSPLSWTYSNALQNLSSSRLPGGLVAFESTSKQPKGLLRMLVDDQLYHTTQDRVNLWVLMTDSRNYLRKGSIPLILRQ